MPLDDLAVPFAGAVCRHLALAGTQARSSSSRFLEACRKHNRGETTIDELRAQTVRHGFENVFDAFHVVGSGKIATPLLHHVLDVVVEVGERALPAEVADDVDERGTQPAPGRVVAAVHGWVARDVLGCYHRAHEDEGVLRVGALEHARDHRVDERLGQLGALGVDEQADGA